MRKRREGFELSVSDVAASTHLREDYIQAIERLDESALPAIGYTLGFVRTYAQALGMDGNVAVKEYKADVVMTTVPLRDAPHVILRRHWRLPRGSVPALTVASAALMVGLWYSTGTQTQAIAAPSDIAAKTPAQYTLQAVEPVYEDGLFTLRTIAPSWIKISEADGTPVLSRIFVTGETWQGAADAGYRVSVRDAGAVELLDGDELIGTLGQAGQPIEDRKLTRDLTMAELPLTTQP